MTAREASLLGTSGARENKKRFEIMPIGGLKGFDIAHAKVSGAHEIGAAPGEDRPALPLGQDSSAIKRACRPLPLAKG